LPPSLESRTLRKLNIRILPFVFFLYVISFLDRINIGFAALTMNRELAITSQQFGLIAGIFFLSYSAFEVPSNLLLHKIGARVWIARILLTWGFFASLTGFVHNVHQLLAVRFLLGVAEAGYFPGMLLYLTYWFPQKQQARAISILLTGIPVTSILGAPLSGLILDHIHWLGFGSWRWLLILEGVPAILCGFLAYFLLPGLPAQAKFLAPEEKNWLVAELAAEERKKLAAQTISVAQVFFNPRVLHLSAAIFFLNVGMYTMSFWLPQIIKSLSTGGSNSHIGILVMIPHLAGAIAMLLVARSSDRRLERRYHAAIPVLCGACALLLLNSAGSLAASVLLLCVVAPGLYSFYGPFYSMPASLLTGYSSAAGLAFVASVGNLGGFVGPYAVGLLNQKTGNMRLGLTVVGLSMLVSASLMLLFPKSAKSHTSS